jgi:hypothetical protein
VLNTFCIPIYLYGNVERTSSSFRARLSKAEDLVAAAWCICPSGLKGPVSPTLIQQHHHISESKTEIPHFTKAFER